MDNIFLIVFLILFVLMAFSYVMINQLNLSNIRKKGNAVPDKLKDVIAEDDLKKAASYSISRGRFSIVHYIFDKVTLIVFLISGLFAWYLSFFAGMGTVFGGILFFGGLFLVSFFLSLPFGYYDTFVLEQKYGFNTSKFSTWIGDLVKELIIGAVLGGLLLLGVLLLVNYFPNTWWLFAWLLSLGFSVFIMFIYPMVIVPMFNKLTPLEGPLAEKIRAMAGQAGISVKKISEMDASKRTKHANAYFAGLGRSKHIVLFDTLIKTHTDDEILGVLAHEIGHWKHKHGLKLLFSSQIFAFAGFFIAGWLLREPAIYNMFGLESQKIFAGLLIIMIFMDIPSFYLSPLGKALSRRYERQADAYSVEMVRDRTALTSALKRLVKENLANLFPHPLYVKFFYSHPPILSRLDSIEKCGKQD